jgi:3',5'-cyclic AMP phosphodiesterase CpdA
MTSSRRCVVLVPYLTHVEPACDAGLRELERRGIAVRRHPSTAAVDRMRCELATTALADGFDELMWIDSDIAFDPDDVDRLRGHDLPIVGGIYAKKGVQDLAVHLEPETIQIQMGEGGALVDVRYLGTGFLCTQRRVYDDIQRTFSLPPCNTRFGKPAVPYFLPMVIADGPGYWYLGEDYAFCERARQAGHKVVVDSTIRLGHIGAYTYGWEDAGQAMPRVASVTFTFKR